MYRVEGRSCVQCGRRRRRRRTRQRVCWEAWEHLAAHCSVLTASSVSETSSALQTVAKDTTTRGRGGGGGVVADLIHRVVL